MGENKIRTEQVDFEENTEKRQFENFTYYRYTRDKSGINRGHLFLPDADSTEITREIRSFPHINRVYRLNNGVQYFFGEQEFYVEEKLDGYNTRIFLYEDDIYAITKGGFVCPFTTEWARLWGEIHNLNDFYNDCPEYVLCAEITGDNPYNCQIDPTLSSDAHLSVFDIIQPHGDFMLPEEKYEISENYGFPIVPTYGKYTSSDIEALRNLVYDLNNRGREGVIMKETSDWSVLKFVTPTSDFKDIKDGMMMIFDIHPFYFRNRLLRSTLFIHEFDLDKDEYARQMGRAFIDGLLPVDSFNRSYEEFTIYVQNRETWWQTRNLIRREVDIETEKITETRLLDKKMYKVRFFRIFEKSTNRFHNILKGFPHTD